MYLELLPFNGMYLVSFDKHPPNRTRRSVLFLPSLIACCHSFVRVCVKVLWLRRPARCDSRRCSVRLLASSCSPCSSSLPFTDQCRPLYSYPVYCHRLNFYLLLTVLLLFLFLTAVSSVGSCRAVGGSGRRPPNRWVDLCRRHRRRRRSLIVLGLAVRSLFWRSVVVCFVALWSLVCSP